MEEWKDVPGWEDYYQVSTEGNVRSKDRVITVKNPVGALSDRRYAGRLLVKSRMKNGYELVSFTAPGRKREYRTVHVLVARTFLGDPLPGHEVRHLDGVRSNSRLANLAYGTRSQNAMDRYLHGTMNQPKGEEASAAKLTNEIVKFIRENPEGLSMRALGRKFGVHHRTVSAVIKCQTWNHI